MSLFANFDIGDLSKPNNDYLRLLEIIGNSSLNNAFLLLTGAKMGGTTVFTSPPLNEAVKGMDKILSITIPNITTSIKADIDGKSPFLFYENLKNFYGGTSRDITEVEDYAFSLCKSLENVDFSNSIKTVGREVFIGCENLKQVNFSTTLETIGDKAFYDCGALERFSIQGKFPKLGDSVFRGSTPNKFTIVIKKEHEGSFGKWLTENASKFNNEGKDVVLKV